MYRMSSIDFPDWLQDQIEKKGWRPRDLAKRARISDAAISRILRGERKADPESLISIARALNIYPVTIFRKAGLLPEADVDQIQFEDWQYLLKQLPEDDQEEIRRIAEMKIEKRQKDKSLKSLQPKKAG